MFLAQDELADWERRVREGGEGAPGYGHLKARLIEAIDERFADAREKREEWLAHPERIDEVLARGAEVAGSRARAVRDRCFAACGLR